MCAECCFTNKSYVLRGGRMSRAQKRSYAGLSASYCLPYTGDVISFCDVYDNSNPVICEIGFGMGDSTAELALLNPRNNYLGIEVFKAGIGRLLWEIENKKIENIRIIEYDARAVIQNMVPDGSVAAFYIFFPDPWPKKRQCKRRLVKRPFTDMLCGKLSGGGSIYMASDWEDYARFALSEFRVTEGLVNRHEDFAPPAGWRPKTKFESKGLAKKHEIYELCFTKPAAP